MLSRRCAGPVLVVVHCRPWGGSGVTMLCSTKPSCLRRRSPHQGAGEADEDLGRAMARRERGDLGWWSDGPDRLKVEFAVGDEMVMAWFQGTTWWSWSLSQGARRTRAARTRVTAKGRAKYSSRRPEPPVSSALSCSARSRSWHARPSLAGTPVQPGRLRPACPRQGC